MPDSQTPDPWVTSLHRQPSHSFRGAYDSIEHAARGDWVSSPNVLSLNGQWDFRFFDRLEDVPAAASPNSPRPYVNG